MIVIFTCVPPLLFLAATLAFVILERRDEARYMPRHDRAHAPADPDETAHMPVVPQRQPGPGAHARRWDGGPPAPVLARVLDGLRNLPAVKR